MNVSELARQLKVTPNELLDKLPGLGFAIGRRAIKIDDEVSDQIIRKWHENIRRERMRSSLKKTSQKRTEEEKAALKLVGVPSIIIVRDLAGRLGLPVTRVIQELMRNGILAAQNERLDFETASIIAEELGFRAELEAGGTVDQGQKDAEDRLKGHAEGENGANLEPRAPVIVVMGHVDHGKTKTLDAIRQTKVMEGEAGGITQHIGAYQVEKKGRSITFIDTPGHEAFTVMRSRGAKIADIAILVVAADDGVQPQTKEAIHIIKAAELPYIVALNKMDKADAEPDKVLAQLAESGVQVEAWGGDIPLVKISAKTGMGIDELLETVLLVADIHADDIRANPKRHAMGTIIESHVDKGEGPVATVLVQTGTLKRNDYIGIGGTLYGRVRAMRDWTDTTAGVATPGMPVKILGFKVTPAVGDIMEVPENWKALNRDVKDTRQVAEGMVATRQMPKQEEEGEKKKMLQIVLKTDVLGSLEAILGMLEKVQDEHIGVEVIQKGLGNVTDTDILRAKDASKLIYAFNVIPGSGIAEMAREEGIVIRQYKIIYELFDDVVTEANKLLSPEVNLVSLGHFETVAIFRKETGRMVIGGRVKEGKIVSGEKCRVWRGEEPLGDVQVESLQVGKEPRKEVPAGIECGLSIKGKVKIELGDKLECYEEQTTERKLKIMR